MAYHKSAGPAVWRDGSAYRGACLKSFSGGMIACVEYRGAGPGGGWCGAAERAIPGFGEAPDWCPYLADIIEDAKIIDDMAALGLRANIKKDLLKVICAMPREFRPKGARELNLRQMQTVIRRAVDAGWNLSLHGD